MLCDSTTVVVAVVRTCPRAILLPMITNRKSLVSFYLYGYGAPLSDPAGRRSSAKMEVQISKHHHCHGFDYLSLMDNSRV